MAHTHHLLLALAGRVDDDLLATARELVAVGEEPQALEILVATLVADRTPLPADLRAEVVELAAARHVEVSTDALAPAGEGRAHAFGAGPAEATARLVDVVTAAAPAGSRARVVWRHTPAGGAPGPVPHPVVLVELGEPAYAPEVVSYRLGAHLARAGLPASVETYAPSDALPAYHRAALAAVGVRPSPGPRLDTTGARAGVGTPPNEPTVAAAVELAGAGGRPGQPGAGPVSAPVDTPMPAASVETPPRSEPGGQAPLEAPTSVESAELGPLVGSATHTSADADSVGPAPVDGPLSASAEHGRGGHSPLDGPAEHPPAGAAPVGPAAVDGLPGAPAGPAPLGAESVGHPPARPEPTAPAEDLAGVASPGPAASDAEPDVRAAPGGESTLAEPGTHALDEPSPPTEPAGSPRLGTVVPLLGSPVDVEVPSAPVRPLTPRRPSPVARSESTGLPTSGHAAPGWHEPPTTPFTSERTRRSGPPLSVVPPMPGQEVSRGPRTAPVTRPTPVVAPDADPTPVQAWPAAEADPPLLASMHDPLSGPLRQPLLDAQLDRAVTGPLTVVERDSAPSAGATPAMATLDAEPAGVEESAAADGRAEPGTPEAAPRAPERSWTQDWASGAWAMPAPLRPAGEETAPEEDAADVGPATDADTTPERAGALRASDRHVPTIPGSLPRPDTDEEPGPDGWPEVDASPDSYEPPAARVEPDSADLPDDPGSPDAEPRRGADPREPARSREATAPHDGTGSRAGADSQAAVPSETTVHETAEPYGAEPHRPAGADDPREAPVDSAGSAEPDATSDRDVPTTQDLAADDDHPTGRRAAGNGVPAFRPLPGGRRRARHRPADAEPASWDLAPAEPHAGDDGLPPPRPVPRSIPRVRRTEPEGGSAGGLFGPGEVPPARPDGPFGTGPRPGAPEPTDGRNGHRAGEDGPSGYASLSDREQELLRRLQRELADREDQPDTRRNGA